MAVSFKFKGYLIKVYIQYACVLQVLMFISAPTTLNSHASGVPCDYLQGCTSGVEQCGYITNLRTSLYWEVLILCFMLKILIRST